MALAMVLVFLVVLFTFLARGSSAPTEPRPEPPADPEIDVPVRRPPSPEPAELPPPPPPDPEPDAVRSGCPEGCDAPPPGCGIKGNVSKTGERIYHLPGQRYYDETKISPGKGETWFCTEGEATSNGWRKAKV